MTIWKMMICREGTNEPAFAVVMMDREDTRDFLAGFPVVITTSQFDVAGDAALAMCVPDNRGRIKLPTNLDIPDHFSRTAFYFESADELSEGECDDFFIIEPRGQWPYQVRLLLYVDNCEAEIHEMRQTMRMVFKDVPPSKIPPSLN